MEESPGRCRCHSSMSVQLWCHGLIVDSHWGAGKTPCSVFQATFLKQGKSTEPEETNVLLVGRTQVSTGCMDKLGVWPWWNGRGRCKFPRSISLLKLLRCSKGGPGVSCNGKFPLVLRRKPPASDLSPWEWCSPDTASQRGCGVSTLGVLRNLVQV